MVRTISGHLSRVGTVAWNGSIVSTGSRDRNILQRDLRASNQFFQKLVGHKQEVCGLRWSFDEAQLASGGNDNKLMIWSLQGGESPLVKFSEHTAAVKAIGWSPHQNGLLASGGGTADRCIRFWNTHTL